MRRLLSTSGRPQPPGPLERGGGALRHGLLRVYERALDWAMHHRRIMRWQPLMLLVLTFALAFAVVKTAGGTFMPKEDTGLLQVDISADANISPDAADQARTQVCRRSCRPIRPCSTS